MHQSRNVKIKITKEDYFRISEEARKRGKTFSWVFREKIGVKNPPWK